MKALVALLILAGSAAACIGSPYAVDMSFAGGLSIDTLKGVLTSDTALFSEDSVVYRAHYDSRLAVRADAEGISIQIPLTETSEPSFQFDAWGNAVRDELDWLKMHTVISVTQNAIDDAVRLAGPGAIMFVGGMGGATGAYANDVTEATLARGGCGDPPVLESALPDMQVGQTQIVFYAALVVLALAVMIPAIMRR